MSAAKKQKPSSHATATAAAADALKPSLVEFRGWPNNLLVKNAHVELIVTLDVGPRVISFRRLDSTNVFKVYDEQMGKLHESQWQIRGGHRLWIAPESDLSYLLDNEPISQWEVVNHELVVINTHGGFVKEMRLSLNKHDVTVKHRIQYNGKDSSVTISPWALSVCRPGGTEIIPQPQLGQHPRDLLPNRVMVFWPYTDFKDPRLDLGTDMIILKQNPKLGPIKLGLGHKMGWVAYHVEHDVFLKRFEYEEGASYADSGCNFETFTNQDMLEVETLGCLQTLKPGEWTRSHNETWSLLKTDTDAVPHAVSAIKTHLGLS